MRGWPESYPIFQPPNAPLLVAAGGQAVAVLASGPARTAALAVSRAAFGVWAWQELTDGDSPVRRVYGAAGLALVARDAARALTG